MAMSTIDSIHAASRGDAEVAIQQAAAKGALSGYQEFIREIFRVAPLMPTPINPACAVAQSALETNYWRSDYWTQDLNPGGIGIWKSGVPSPFNPPYVQNGERSARLMLLEIWAHLHPTPPYPDIVQDMVEVDGWLDEVQAAQQDPNRPSIRTLQDWHIQYTSSSGNLECTWACDPDYSPKIVERGNYLFPSLPDQTQGTTGLTFGNVPHPPYQRRIIEITAAYTSVPARYIVGTCVHRMLGGLWGTDSYFRAVPPDGLDACPAQGEPGYYDWGACHSLTDYGIGGYLDDADDGTILMWNDPRGTRAPIANGGPGDGGGDGPAFIAAYGVDAVNRDLVSIELSGQQDTPMTPAQFESLCQLIAYWHDQADVPWDQFPVNPASGVVTQMQHYEFADKPCPYSVVRGRTSEYQSRVKEIMRAHQEGTGTDGGSSGGSTTTGKFAVNDLIQVVDGPLNVRDTASTDGAVVGDLASGTRLCVLDGPVDNSADVFEWYQIDGGGLQGWVAGDYCSLVSAGGCAGGAASPMFAAGDQIQVTDGPLNIRSGPGLSYDVIASYAQWTDICVLDGPVFADGYEWYEVEGYGYRGWVAGEFCGLLTQGGCL